MCLPYQSAGPPNHLMKPPSSRNLVSHCLIKEVYRYPYEALATIMTHHSHTERSCLWISLTKDCLYIPNYTAVLLLRCCLLLPCVTGSWLTGNSQLSKGAFSGFSSSSRPTFHVASPSVHISRLQHQFLSRLLAPFHSTLRAQHAYDSFPLSFIWESLWYIFFLLEI